MRPDNGTPLVEAYDVERVLPDIDAHYGDRRADLLGHGVLLGFGAPSQLRLLAGQEHGRTIPLADITLRSVRGVDDRLGLSKLLRASRRPLLRFCMASSEAATNRYC
jgi:hypothetical protein